jgi:hypothetical protein
MEAAAVQDDDPPEEPADDRARPPRQWLLRGQIDRARESLARLNGSGDAEQEASDQEAGEQEAEGGAVERKARIAGLIGAIDQGEMRLRELNPGLSAPGAAPAVLRGIMLAPNLEGLGARNLLVVFGADDGGFAIPKPLLRAKRPHLLFVQDRQHCLALLGVERLGASYDECLASILRIQQGLQAAELMCLGMGASAYSALRYGLDLGAGLVAALGPLSRVQDDGTIPGVRSPRRMRRLLDQADRLGNDLAAAYEAAQHRPKLVLCRPHGLAEFEGVTVAEAPAAGLVELMRRAG